MPTRTNCPGVVSKVDGFMGFGLVPGTKNYEKMDGYGLRG